MTQFPAPDNTTRYQLDAVYTEAGILSGASIPSDSAGTVLFSGTWAEAGDNDVLPASALNDGEVRQQATIGRFYIHYDPATACLSGNMSWSPLTIDVTQYVRPFPRTCLVSSVQARECAVSEVGRGSPLSYRPGGRPGLAGVWRTSLGDNMTVCQNSFDSTASYFIRDREPGYLVGFGAGFAGTTTWCEASPQQYGPQLMVLTGDDNTLVMFTYYHGISLQRLSDAQLHQKITWTRAVGQTASNADCERNAAALDVCFTPYATICDDPEADEESKEWRRVQCSAASVRRVAWSVVAFALALVLAKQ